MTEFDKDAASVVLMDEVLYKKKLDYPETLTSYYLYTKKYYQMYGKLVQTDSRTYQRIGIGDKVNITVPRYGYAYTLNSDFFPSREEFIDFSDLAIYMDDKQEGISEITMKKIRKDIKNDANPMVLLISVLFLIYPLGFVTHDFSISSFVFAFFFVFLICVVDFLFYWKWIFRLKSISANNICIIEDYVTGLNEDFLPEKEFCRSFYLQNSNFYVSLNQGDYCELQNGEKVYAIILNKKDKKVIKFYSASNHTLSSELKDKVVDRI